MFAEGSHVWAFMLAFLADVGMNCICPLMLDNRPTYFCCYSSTTAESLRSNPIWKSSETEFFLHTSSDLFNFRECLLFGHRCPICMSTTPDNDCETITSMVTKTNFLMRSSKHLDDNIIHFDLSHFELWRIDDKELRGNCTFVLCSSKEDSVS